MNYQSERRLKYPNTVQQVVRSGQGPQTLYNNIITFVLSRGMDIHYNTTPPTSDYPI
jgi:hypothetical protein